MHHYLDHLDTEEPDKEIFFLLEILATIGKAAMHKKGLLTFQDEKRATHALHHLPEKPIEAISTLSHTLHLLTSSSPHILSIALCMKLKRKLRDQPLTAKLTHLQDKITTYDKEMAERIAETIAPLCKASPSAQEISKKIDKLLAA